MLTIRDACRRPFATITIVMVANGRRHPAQVKNIQANKPDVNLSELAYWEPFEGILLASPAIGAS